jgi:hypothetical protein
MVVLSVPKVAAIYVDDLPSWARETILTFLKNVTGGSILIFIVRDRISVTKILNVKSWLIMNDNKA